MYRPMSGVGLARPQRAAPVRRSARWACAIAGAFLALGAEPSRQTVAPPPAPAALVTGAAPLELTAIEQPGLSPADRPAALRFVADVSAALDLSWVVRTADSRGLVARVEVANSWCAVDQQYPIRAADWAFGGLYTDRYVFRVPPFTVVGPSVVRVWVTDASAGRPSIEVGRLPCWVGPAVVPSTFDGEVIRRRFGHDAYPLRKACRLFPGVEVTVPVEAAPAPAYSGIAVISCMRYDAAVQQAAPVLDIEVTSKEGPDTERVTLSAGVHTSLGEIDAARPGVVKIGPVEIAASLPYPGVSWKGGPIALHQYLGQCAFSRPVSPAQIRLRHVAEAGAIDLFDIVLLATGPDRALP
ncbi:MAG: hypothetical protein FJY92_03915 [Candidatus Hydrogenedentes bacterium]|nr:hypothetical protein [Candidatus Hydrogenedentota bacterium]